MINRYPGRCGACRGTVDAGAGQVVNENGRWQTYHNQCAPERIAPPVGEHDGWHHMPLAAIDVETTSNDPFEARVISAAVVLPDGSGQAWLVNPGVPIPPDATAINGITDEMVQKDGLPARQALAEIGVALGKLVVDEVPIVAFCAPYDVTVLHRELGRHHLPAVNWDDAVIIDPSVLHRHVEPTWFAQRTLGDLCRYYQVELARAHDALSDARAARELARSIAARHREIAQTSPRDLHRRQIQWHREQAMDLQRSFDRRGIRKKVPTEWPLETERRG